MTTYDYFEVSYTLVLVASDLNDAYADKLFDEEGNPKENYNEILLKIAAEAGALEFREGIDVTSDSVVVKGY